jgi:hypothetical protein
MVERIGVESYLPLAILHITDAQFVGTYKDHWGEVSLDGRRQGSKIVGTARLRDKEGPLRLIRLASMDSILSARIRVFGPPGTARE